MAKHHDRLGRCGKHSRQLRSNILTAGNTGHPTASTSSSHTLVCINSSPGHYRSIYCAYNNSPYAYVPTIKLVPHFP